MIVGEALNIIRREGVAERIIYSTSIPRIHSSSQEAQIIESDLREGLNSVRAEQIARLKMRDEVLA